MTGISKSQIDLLGVRLRTGPITDGDLRLLDSVRRTYSPGYDLVISKILAILELEPTGRPAKSTTSIIEKLQRESLRLSQMQDIAGCRIIVSDIPEQELAVANLQGLFPGSSMVDRREFPSHGYRAVHLIAMSEGLPIEVQVRTVLQHTWAELSEKYADVINPAIKYGGGPAGLQDRLADWSDLVRHIEVLEMKVGDEMSSEIVAQRVTIRRDMEEIIAALEELKD